MLVFNKEFYLCLDPDSRLFTFLTLAYALDSIARQ